MFLKIFVFFFWTVKTFVKRTRGKISNNFVEILGKISMPGFLLKKKFMFSSKIKEALTKSLPKLLAKCLVLMS